MITLRQSTSQKIPVSKKDVLPNNYRTLQDYFLLEQKKQDKDSDKHVKDGSKSTKKEAVNIKVNAYKTSKISEKVF